MEQLYLVGFLGAAAAILFAWVQSRRVLSYSEGSEAMRKIAAAIRSGADAYLKHQYATVAKVFLVVFVLLLLMAFGTGGEMLSQFTPFAFLTGGVWSMLSGLVGMKIATSANARTAQAASESLNHGLRVAFSSGSVMGFTVVGLGMLDISLWFFFLRAAAGIDDPVTLGNIMVMNGMGASFMAPVRPGWAEASIPKPPTWGPTWWARWRPASPRTTPGTPPPSPTTWGITWETWAGMGADLYESYVGSILATFSLGACAGYGWEGMILPILLAVCGILCSIVGTFFVKTEENASQKSLLRSPAHRHLFGRRPLRAWPPPPSPTLWWGNWGVYAAILCGLIGGCAIGYFTEYYTSDTYKPTQKLAAAAETGSATVIIGGLSLGMLSTIASILIVAIAILISFYAAGGGASFDRGLYGIGISAVGMLSTLGITLATDAYGPVADNAGALPRCPACPSPSGSAPTPWTPWATPPPPRGRASPSARPPSPPWPCWCPM